MWEISSLARKRSTEHGLDTQLCGVLDIWWQTQTKNYTAQDARVARALKFPGTYNAPTFETICLELSVVCQQKQPCCCAPVHKSIQVSHIRPIADYQPTLTDNFASGCFKIGKSQPAPRSPVPRTVCQLRVPAALPAASCS